MARPSLQHAADSKYCVRCGTPYVYAAAYVGHLGDYRCPNCGHARPPLEVAARDDRAARARARRVRPRHAGGHAARSSSRCPASTTSTTRSAPRRSRARSAPSLDEIAAGLARFSAAFGRFERIPVGEQALLLLLIKNPAGANEAVRTLVDGGAPRVAVVALNDGIADGRDVSWIWDVDFEPLLAGLETLVATGEPRRRARAALRVRRPRRGAIEVEPDLGGALDRGLELTPDGGELVVLPTYTAMLGLQRIVADARAREAVLGARRMTRSASATSIRTT